jgi:dienelactone hydrolase
MTHRIALSLRRPLPSAHPGRLDRSVARLGGHPVLAAAELIVAVQLFALAMTSDVSQAGRLVGAALGLVVAGMLLAALTSEQTALRGVGSMVAGVLGITAGGGIALAWFATTGLSVTAVVAAASLAAGLLLLGAGTWLLLRTTPGWWRLLAIPVAFVIFQFGLLPLAAAVYGTHPPQTPTSASMPAGAERVSFDTSDGIALVGWYTPSHNRAAVIVLPGSGGEKGSTIQHATVLADHGYGVLAIDSRGTGESGGIGMAWGWHGTDDISGAITWLSGRPEIDQNRIGALGLSMGGEEAITAAAAGTRLEAVVAEGVSARVPGDLAYLPNDPIAVIERLETTVMWTAADLMTDAVPPVPLRQAFAAASRVPVLLIVGSDRDDAAAAPGFKAAAPSLHVWDVPDTPHIQSLALHPAEWETRVINFLDQSLRD